ncbi:hypothetical protein H072_10202 [Dactylellina haptotyla CBS 200.50]|uniref:chitin synthase n=1 Tax=Dactylellina haptotyla (strain CBS 200.50) TaxID=1284197 RepID=S8A0U9_DACHA|nr:hypothetical protein H072_10202 [Dactylellina haptotyla CBS 200.50]
MAASGDEGLPPGLPFPGPESPGLPPIRFEPGDIVFMVLGIPIYVAILIEWIAWLVAFLYCFYHCWIKARRSRDYNKVILAVFMAILFTILRLFFIPVLIVSIPMPATLRARLPDSWATLLELIAFYAFVVLLLFPATIIIYNMFNKSVGRKSRYATLLHDDSPKVIIIMPCYNEIAENVMKCINSIAGQEYPMACIHVCLSLDSDEISKEYLEVLSKLSVPTVRRNKYPVSIDVRYQNMRVTVSRYKHGGKRHTQKKTFQMIDKLYEKYLERRDDVYLLFIDSDCILDRYCIQNFMYEMDFLPREKNRRQPMAMTGVITSRIDKGQGSFITLLQDMEYIHGQLFERAVESSCGAVTCLPGALTCLKFSAFRNMSVFYFADMADKHDNPFDYGQYHLGEDRWLTHLFMIGAKHSYQIGFSTSAFCKTEACATWSALVNQRTRWFKGFITNEAAMLTDWQLWQRYPLLCIFRMMQDTIRTTALLLVLLVLSLMTKVQTVENLPLPLIALSLGANWFFMFWYGWQLKRKKAYLYPILFLANPVVNWWYLVASVWSYKRRSWGGPRVRSRPGEVVQAEDEDEESDGLPELSDRERDAIREAALPWRTLSGRFVPARVDEDGLYHRSDLNLPLSGRSSVVLPQLLASDAASITTRNSEVFYGDMLAPPLPGHSNRYSGISNFSFDSEVGRLYAPAQTFLRSDRDTESRYTTPAPFDEYGAAVPIPTNDFISQDGEIYQFQNSHTRTGDLGEMTLDQIHQAQFDAEMPHAISDNTPTYHRYTPSVQQSIDLLYPPSIARVDRTKRPGSPDSWTRDDDAAFSTVDPASPPADNSFGTPISSKAKSLETDSSKRKAKLFKKKPTSMEFEEGHNKEKKSGVFRFLKKH